MRADASLTQSALQISQSLVQVHLVLFQYLRCIIMQATNQVPEKDNSITVVSYVHLC